jgi:hypothetical protein
MVTIWLHSLSSDIAAAAGNSPPQWDTLRRAWSALPKMAAAFFEECAVDPEATGFRIQ